MSYKFKLSEEERIEIEHLAYVAYNLGSDHIIDRIESIIQDLGNSIQDGWIDVERINKYGKHQHKRGVLGDRYITFDYWKSDKQPKK